MKVLFFILYIFLQGFLFPQNLNLSQIKKEKIKYLINPGANLIKNPGFENEISSYWYYDRNIYSIDKLVHHSGNSSLKFSNSNSNIYKLCAQKIKITPGAKYYFSAYIKTRNIKGNDNGATIAIEWFDEDNKWLSGKFPPGVKETSGWTLIKANTLIPENAYSAHLICYVRKGMTGEAWFDDVNVKRILSPNINAYYQTRTYRGIIAEKNAPIKLQTKLSDYGMNANLLKVKATLVDYYTNEVYQVKISSVNPKHFSNIEFEPKQLPEGKFRVDIELITPNNVKIDSTSLILTTELNKSKNNIYIDKYLRTIVSGKPFFPLGMFWSRINESDLKIYSKSGFNCIMPYTSPTNEEMSLADQYGLKVIYSLKDFYAGTKYCPKQIKSVNDEELYIKNIVDKMKNNNALLAWYLSDELPIDFIERIEKHYKWVLEKDQNHPILIVQNNINEIELYRSAFDVTGTDPYPVGTSTRISMVGSWTEKTIKQLEHLKPVWMVLQAHNLSVYFEQFRNRTPDFREIKNMAWQAICEGAKGLIFYSFFDLKRDPNFPFEKRWQNVKKVSEEIGELSDVLLSIESVPSLKISEVPDWFHCLIKRKGNKIYLLTVNDGDGNGEITFSFPNNIKSLKLHNGKNLIFSKNSFKDIFNELDVKIYEILLSD